MDLKIAHKIEDKQRTKDIEIDENVTFEEMFLRDTLLKGLHSCGYVRPSPIQLSAIPLGRCGLDLIVQAKSGTGKTCVFTVVALEMITVKAKSTQVLIIAPTREIAVQIGQVINSVGSFFPDLKAYTFIGGINILEDKAKLSCCHIAIGTPGRLNQLVSLGHLNLSNIRLLVVDEADQLLTGQFKSSILELIKTSPLNKQILALSATYPKEVTEFLDQLMRSPSHVRLGKESPGLIGVKQFVRLLPNHPQSFAKHKLKFQELLSVLSLVSFNQCLVFSNSQLRAESVCNDLKSAGWPAAFLTGAQMQKDRLQSFFDLCSYKCRILVSTDLSARGLDSEHVNLVVNMDIPIDQATYLHRIGRAGRFGSIGVAISLACEGNEWEAMRAVVNKTNVVIRVLHEKFDSDTVQKDVEALETIRPLDENGFAQFIEKVNEKKLKQNKMKGKVNKHDTILETGKKYLTEKDNGRNKKLQKKKLEKVKSNLQNTQVQKKDQVCMKTIYSVMCDYTKEKNIVSFSHNAIMNQMSDDMKNLVKLDIKELSSSSFVKEYPSKVAFDVLDKFITKRDNNNMEESTPVEIMNDSFDKIKALQKVIDGAQTLQSLKNFVEDSENENNMSEPIISSQPKISEETKTICNDATVNKNERIDDCSLSLKSDSETEGKNLIRMVDNIEKETEEGIDSYSMLDRNKNTFLQNGETSRSKKKIYENTGCGVWEPVTTKDEYDSKDSQFYENSNQQMYSNVGNFSNNGNWYQNQNFNSYCYNNTYNTPYSFHSSIDMYVQSAQKFALMMEYARNCGKMSAWIAQDNHNKLLKNLNKKNAN